LLQTFNYLYLSSRSQLNKGQMRFESTIQRAFPPRFAGEAN